MLDLLNFDDSRLQMHRFTAVVIENNKLSSQPHSTGLLPPDSEDTLVHQSHIARINYAEYRSVFGIKKPEESSQIQLVHVAAREQQRNEGRVVSRQAPSELSQSRKRRSQRR